MALTEDQRGSLIFEYGCAVCIWLKEWSRNEHADMNILMEPYIPHRLQHSVDELTKTIRFK